MNIEEIKSLIKELQVNIDLDSFENESLNNIYNFIEQQQKEIDLLKNMIEGQSKVLHRKDNDIENLKRCGNCKNWKYNYDDLECKKDGHFISPCDYCKNWQFDGKTQKDREVE